MGKAPGQQLGDRRTLASATRQCQEQARRASANNQTNLILLSYLHETVFRKTAMMYSRKTLDALYAEQATIAVKLRALQNKYIRRTYKTVHGKEFATHGLLRRLATLVRCIENIFRILPPEHADLPTPDQRIDATISLQAFIINIFGCADNLAWIWVHENRLELNRTQVGLRAVNSQVRQSFSAEFQNILDDLDPWFRHLENFRHALAHRIPLYIPPYVVREENARAYHDLEVRIAECAVNHTNSEWDRLVEMQNALTEFRPVFTHSFEEESPKSALHPQVLADFNTIDQLGTKIYEELERAR